MNSNPPRLPDLAVAGKKAWLRRTLAPVLLLALAYYLAGLVGLHMQSEQTGITPFWPASGVALVAFVIYGFHLWPAIFIGMCLIALTAGVPVELALLSGFGSTLEIILPLAVARHHDFGPNLKDMRQLLIFLAICWTGPVISAGIGSLTFYWASHGALEIPLLHVFLTWWLGNSFGMLLIGSAGLILYQNYREDALHWPVSPYLLLTALLSIMISVSAFSLAGSLYSTLLLSLMIPVVILSSVLQGFIGTLLPVGLSVLVMILQSRTFEPVSQSLSPISDFYLDIVQLWIITLTGLLVSVAHRQSIRSREVEWVSNHDGLTLLKNRHYFEELLDELCRSERRQDRQITLLFMDLNHFKNVNDSLGHLAGDHCLQHVSEHLREMRRPSDKVIRWGGDEFAVLLPGCDIDDAEAIAHSINQRLREMPFREGDQEFPVTFSIGATTLQPGDTPQTLIDRADRACYQAKKRPNRIHVIHNF